MKGDRPSSAVRYLRRMTTRYRANEPRFVDETVDGEALMMDMVRGNYYCCAGASAVAWNALKQGRDVDAVAAVLVGAYGISVEQASADLGQFVGALVAEDLLVAVDDDTAAATVDAPTEVAAGSDYDGLRFDRFTDLADLILLDPVHDVSEAGWPHKAE